MMNLYRHGMFFLAALFLGNSSVAYSSASSQELQLQPLKSTLRFATWQGIEPDKWATLWLIKRHLSTDAYFLLTPPDAALPRDALAFGVPGASLRRANHESMFSRLKKAMNLDSTALDDLDQIIHDVEVNIWDAPAHPHSTWFESMYRQLQARYERDQVPVDCYLAFFDAAVRLFSQPDAQIADYAEKLSLKSECPGLQRRRAEFVAQLDHVEILREISLGKKVVFVDTREDEEFDEVHLPGAQIVRLRDVNAETVKRFLDADLVVPYCVKDFRGFEVAKSMRQLGVEHVATLSPNGLKGWLKADLPVVRAETSTEQQAMQVLLQCAMEPSVCLKESQQ
jgi:rhodanese-related sulfurtransferase